MFVPISFNVLYSTEREQKNLSDFQKKALIGLLLGDVHIERAKPSHNARLCFDQSLNKHSEYIMYLYSIFKDFVGTPPKATNRKPDIRTGKIYNSLQFKTLRYPFFSSYHDLFYLKGTKLLPKNINELITDIGLAFWIMDDGGLSTNGGLIIHTNSFTKLEVEILVNLLQDKFQLQCKPIIRNSNQWAINIPKKEMVNIQNLIKKYVHYSMKHKIGL